jgi:hypothetical protein
MPKPRDQWTLEDLWTDLEEFERELNVAGLRKSSIHTYVDRTSRFLRWLAGDYQPQGPR